VPEIPEHLAGAYRHLIGLPEAPPPPPWRQLRACGVGGLTDVGFLDSTDMLLVMSHDGRGVFDCLTGERLARDRSREFEFDTANLLARGIGALGDRLIRTAGPYGGGLAVQTADGWRLERLTLVWPHDYLFLTPPGHHVLGAAFNKPGDVTRLPAMISEWRASAFSPTGKAMVVATSSQLDIYRRDA